MHTHTHRTHDKKSVLLSQKKEWFFIVLKNVITNSREKNAKKFLPVLFQKGLLFLRAQRKKRSPFPLLFPSLCALRGLEKKNLFGDEMNAPRSSLFTQHLITMAASSLTAAALGSKVAFANKVRFMSAARCVDSSAFFLLLLLFRTRARFVRKGI